MFDSCFRASPNKSTFAADRLHPFLEFFEKSFSFLYHIKKNTICQEKNADTSFGRIGTVSVFG